MEHLISQDRSASTLARHRSAIRANIKPTLGKIDITKLGPAEIDAFYAKLLKSGLTPLSVRKSHAILSASFAPPSGRAPRPRPLNGGRAPSAASAPRRTSRRSGREAGSRRLRLVTGPRCRQPPSPRSGDECLPDDPRPA